MMFKNIAGEIKASDSNGNMLIDNDSSGTCVSDLSVASGNHIVLQVDRYNGTWYPNAVPLALQASSSVGCSGVKVRTGV